MTFKKNLFRWFAVAIFFLFMLLHQTDRLLIGPLTSAIMAEFNLTETQMGSIFTGSLILGSVFYPIWGLLFDRFARPKLLALASLIWGLTTWMSSIAPSARIFLITRASTGIDDSSYPGIASLVSDYFQPDRRSRIFGFLQLTIPLGYIAGILLALNLGPVIGWRMIYLFTGLAGLIMAGLILIGVKDLPRGSSEPAYSGVEEINKTPVTKSALAGLLRIPTLQFLFLQGVIGVLPWQVITFWSFRYLEVERNFTAQTISSVMIPAVLMIGLGYFLGGFLGDLAYQRTPQGRLYVALFGVLMGAFLLTATLNTPLEKIGLFRCLLSATCLFIPLASPNIATAVYDVVLPEVRSTATSIQYFLGNIGSAFAPLLAGIIAERFSLETAILSIGLVSWLISAAVLLLAVRFMPIDMAAMHQELTRRAAGETAP